jgi:site-specific recombinase XerD
MTNAVRAAKKLNVPTVMTREEVAAVIALMDGIPKLVTKLLYGSGLRLMEAARLGIKDIDFAMKQLTVRSGKGDKDRFMTFPATLTPLLQDHLIKVKILHQQDLAKFVFPYDEVRQSASPDQALLEFLQSSYAAAADSGSWNRLELERTDQP